MLRQPSDILFCSLFRPGTCYETGATVMFYHGRTDTIRTCTEEMIDWCKAMLDKTKSVSTLMIFDRKKKISFFLFMTLILISHKINQISVCLFSYLIQYIYQGTMVMTSLCAWKKLLQFIEGAK